MHIILMRHAEKPANGNGLSDIGKKRASLLPDNFKINKTLFEIGAPSALYAIAPYKEGRSIRSIQTLIHLAERFNLTINQKYTKHDLEDLVEAVKRDNQSNSSTAIICCNRTSIPVLARLFGVFESSALWSNEVYNKLWIISFYENKPNLIELSLNTLPSDSIFSEK